MQSIQRAYYSDSIGEFRRKDPAAILGTLVKQHSFSTDPLQRNSWQEQITILQGILEPYFGSIYLEYSIPRMGKRIDTLLLIDSVIFVIEFKVGEDTFKPEACDQVLDYALDLKNFHDPSHHEWIAPILVATRAKRTIASSVSDHFPDRVLKPLRCGIEGLPETIRSVLQFCKGSPISSSAWDGGRYSPTPTIVEAALALYAGHSVENISRNDASAFNLGRTSLALSRIIEESKRYSRKTICFVTGVPGAGKTLVGLNLANQHIDTHSDLYSVYLSGNGPLVSVLREALIRDKVRRERDAGNKITKGEAGRGVKAFIQNVHHFRDDCIVDSSPPKEHVALFDEAQRAWTLEQTSSFMKRKKGVENFNQSEPEFLLSCMDRHKDWAMVVCLVGGGQEINTGEAGIAEWITALERSFPHWHIFISSRLHDSEYAAGGVLDRIKNRPHVFHEDALHLAVSMRSFRAEHVSLMVKQILDSQSIEAGGTYHRLGSKYPIVLTRDLSRAKDWLREHARGTERFGIVVSSQAERLKPHAICVKSPMDPVHWFLDAKDDIRSSYYLEDVATEFHVQGLELDWACVTWDGDFRKSSKGWEHWSFSGSGWRHINQPERQSYLKNAYRVLLTRARQGMAICVPEGDPKDPTRDRKFYDPTYEYLADIGFPIL